MKTKIKRNWSGCVLASFEGLQKAAAGQHRKFVWPDEGEFKGDTWIFNDEHAGEYEPLLIDMITAKMMLKLHSALNPDNQAKFKTYVAKDRGYFGHIHQLTMEKVSITGFTSR